MDAEQIKDDFYDLRSWVDLSRRVFLGIIPTIRKDGTIRYDGGARCKDGELADRVDVFVDECIQYNRSLTARRLSQISKAVREGDLNSLGETWQEAGGDWDFLERELQYIAAMPSDDVGSTDGRDSSDVATMPQVVTMKQIAGLCQVSKPSVIRWFEGGDIPAPDWPGGNGKAHKWDWTSVQPRLGELVPMLLPKRFPSPID